METLAHLHLALAREIPGDAELVSSQRRRTPLCPGWHQVPGQAVLVLLFLSYGLTLFAAARNAIALQAGDRGEAVIRLQETLTAAGYYNGPVTGFYGNLTEAAVSQFQQAKGLTTDGIAGSQTLALLKDNNFSQRNSNNPNRTPSSPTPAGNTLKKGSRGPDVTHLQKQLHAAGYYNGPITGFYGKLTQSAVNQFQQARGLKSDGIAGSQTLSVLQEATLSNAPPNSEPQGNINALAIGDRGLPVSHLQQSLHTAGYDAGAIDGIYGAKTRAAVTQFQQDQNLTADGIANDVTLSTLQSSTIADSQRPDRQSNEPENTPEIDPLSTGDLSLGDTGAAVLSLQTNLRTAGYYNNGPVMGYFGTQTQAAVTEFQKVHGLEATGIVDAGTLAALRLATQSEPSRSSSTRQSLSYSVRGPAVARLQTQLRAAGYYTGTIDGIYGSTTEDAVKGLQVAEGLTVNGIADAETLRVLTQVIAPGRQTQSTRKVLSSGARGAVVVELQEKLRSANYYSGRIDGIYGPDTEKAVVSFQRSKRLREDGIVGPQTLSALAMTANKE